MNKLMAYWSILMKDMRNYYLKPPNISWGIIFPVAWTLMFFLRSPGEMDIREILPGVMALSILFGTTSMLAVTSTFLGLFIAVSVSEVFEAQTFSNFFRFPMLFLCGLFIPIGNLPFFLQPLSYILPLTYGADMLKESINADGAISLWLSLLVLIGFSLALFTISTHNIKKKWIY